MTAPSLVVKCCLSLPIWKGSRAPRPCSRKMPSTWASSAALGTAGGTGRSAKRASTASGNRTARIRPVRRPSCRASPASGRTELNEKTSASVPVAVARPVAALARAVGKVSASATSPDGGEDGDHGQRHDPASRPSHPDGEMISTRHEHREAPGRDHRGDRVMDQHALHECGGPEDHDRELPRETLAAAQADRERDERDNPEQRAERRRLVGAERENGVDDPLRAAGWRDDVDGRQESRRGGHAQGERRTRFAQPCDALIRSGGNRCREHLRVSHPVGRWGTIEYHHRRGRHSTALQ